MDQLVKQYTQQDLENLPKGFGMRPGFGSCGGASSGASGSGSADGGDAFVWQLLRAGSPRLALARAMGVPFVPTIFNIRGTFATTTTTDVPTVGATQSISQDTLISGMLVRIQNESSTAFQNSFQTMSDFFLNWQSCIEGILQVQGSPTYNVVSTYTPLATIADALNGNAHWPDGWVLNFNQQLMMSFHADITLPFAPLEVICTFRGWLPSSDLFQSDQISRQAALQTLYNQYGYCVPPGYGGGPCT